MRFPPFSRFATSRTSRLCVLLVVFALLLAVKIGWAADQPSPIVVDELGYLGNARYLATGDGLVAGHGRSAYKVGYSVALMPAFLVETDPAKAYRVALFLGSLLSSLLFPLLYLFSGRLCPRIPWSDRAAVALVAALTPGASAYGQSAMSYNVLAPGLVVFCFLALRLDGVLRRDDGGWGRLFGHGLALGLLAGALYAVHERAVALFASSLVVLFVAALIFRRRSVVALLGLVAGMAPMVAWSKSVQIPGANYRSLERSRDVLGIISSWTDPLVESVGQSWYLLASSAAVLACVGFFLVLRPRALRGVVEARPVFWALVTAAVGGLFAASAIFMSRAGTEDPTYLVYGRYNEVFLPVLLVLGLLLVHPAWEGAPGGRPSWRHWVAAGVATALLVFAAHGLLGWARADVFRARTYVFNTPALYPFTSTVGFHTWRIGCFLAVLGGALSLAFAWRFRAGVGLLLAFMVWQGIGVERFWTWYSEQRDRQHQGSTVIAEIQPRGGEVSWDESIWPVFHFYLYDYFLPEHRLREVERESLATADGPFVVTATGDPAVAGEGAALVMVEALPKNFESYRPHLWVRPGPEQEEILRRGWYFPGACVTCLDPRTTRASVAVVDPADRSLRLEGGTSTTIRVRLTNAGASPWPTRGMLKTTEKAVRIARVWYADDGEPLVESRVDLHQSLMPGRSRERDLHVRATGADWRPLPPGRYRLEIGLVQEDGFWLEGDEGDAAAVLEVEIP